MLRVAQSVQRLGYELDDGEIGARFMAITGQIHLLHNFNTGSVAHKDLYVTGSEGYFRQSKEAGV
jgi:hypothetical protein